MRYYSLKEKRATRSTGSPMFLQKGREYNKNRFHVKWALKLLVYIILYGFCLYLYVGGLIQEHRPK